MRRLIALIGGVALLVGMSACGGGDSQSADGTATGQSQTRKTPVEQPADLTGSWRQTNSNDEDSAMEAIITADTIEIDWTGTDSKSLYWKGSYEAPASAGDWKWTSQGDTETMQSALLASQDDSKDFSYSAKNKELTFELSAMGTTTTVRMSKQ